MKPAFTISFLLISLFAFSQREFTYTEDDTAYTMKRYVFMLLKSGETKSRDSTEAAKFQKLHMAHLNKMAEQGKLMVAGPFQEGGEHRGLLIFDVETVDEALKLEGADPMVASGRLKMDAFYWWGAKGTVIK